VEKGKQESEKIDEKREMKLKKERKGIFAFLKQYE